MSTFNKVISISGVYKIINKLTKTVYIGSSSIIGRRWYRHRLDLQKNKHPNQYLQNAWNKYGETAFIFKIQEKCPVKYLIKREQYWLDKNTNSYNLRFKASSNYGLKQSEETKRKMSISGKRRWKLWKLEHPKPIKVKKKHIPWNKGKKLSLHIRKKLSLAKLRNPSKYWQNKHRSKETILKISQKLKGRKLSKQHAKKIGLSHVGLVYNTKRRT